MKRIGVPTAVRPIPPIRTNYDMPDGHHSNHLAQQPSQLRVSPFEHYMVCDDTASYPMCFTMRFEFDGIFNRPELEQALRDCLVRHVLLTSVITGNSHHKTSNLMWERIDPGAFIFWNTVPATGGIDIRREIGLRVYHTENLTSGKTQLVLQIHHASCDGIGVVGFMEDVLAHYDSACNSTGQPIETTPINDQLLEKRHHYDTSLLGWIRRSHVDVSRSLNFLGSPTHPLASNQKTDQDSNATLDPQLPLLSTTLPSQEFHEYVKTSKSHSVTVNDLMIRDLFLTLRDWNLTSTAHSQGPLAIGVPVNLRQDGDHLMPAANYVSMVFLKHKRHLCDESTLLREVNRETQYIKRKRVGLTLGRVIQLLGKINGGVPRLFTKRRCFATAMLSNLGEPFKNSFLNKVDNAVKSGNVKLLNVELYPPIRDMTHASFGVVTYGGVLNVALRYDATHFSRDRAQDLLNAFRSRLALQNTPPSSHLVKQPTLSLTR